jgi:hypothetical protein
MHLLGNEWAGANHTFSTATAKDYNLCMPALIDFVYDRPDDLRDYPIIAANLDRRLDELAVGNVPLGVCHRDFHPPTCMSMRRAPSPCSISTRRVRTS